MNRASTFICVLERLDGHVTPGARILDFGCGSGKMLQELCSLGYDAFGCDLHRAKGTLADELTDQGRLRLIEEHPYTLPFDDGFFDAVVSDQVFEHVKDYDSALREIRRVLKDKAPSLHVFPARYTPFEPHVRVPGATVVQARWWLLLWARLGIRNEYQKGDSAAVVATKNQDWLPDNTNYLTRRQIRDAFSGHFPVVRFSESAFLRRDEPGGRLRRQIGRLPFAPRLYSALRSRVLYAVNP